MSGGGVFCRAVCLLILGLVFCLGHAHAYTQVHLVVDVSGNMQQLDPAKQRIAAVRSFVQQFPAGTRAGVWTYAKSVNRLVPPGIVDENWRQHTLQALNTLGGYGNYADVGEALLQATYYWRSDDVQKDRHIVLITNSGLRVSDTQSANQRARQQLLVNLLPTLQRNHIKIHILAFGQADATLYQKITSLTRGSYQSLSKPADLLSAFKTLNLQFKWPVATTVSQSAVSEAAAPVVAAAVETVPHTSKPPAAQLAQNYVYPPKPDRLSAATAGADPVKSRAVHQDSLSMPAESAQSSLETQKAEEIRGALAHAEAELTQLLTEFASIPEDTHSAGSNILIGQESTDPLVITLADGSVLVAPQGSDVQGLADQVLAVAAPGQTVVATENGREIKSAAGNDIWSMILTVLVIVNLLVIFLLFVGRFLWRRYKYKVAEAKSDSV